MYYLTSPYFPSYTSTGALAALLIHPPCVSLRQSYPSAPLYRLRYSPDLSIHAVNIQGKSNNRPSQTLRPTNHNINDADALLKHWTQRQAAREIPFWFKNLPMAKQHEKRDLAQDNNTTPAGPTDQPEGGQQGTGSNQERGNNGEHQGDGKGATGNVTVGRP
jgi:hypothetical protein